MTPDNAGYMEAAYALAAAVYLGYVLVLRLRERRLRSRLARLAASDRSRGPEGA